MLVTIAFKRSVELCLLARMSQGMIFVAFSRFIAGEGFFLSTFRAWLYSVTKQSEWYTASWEMRSPALSLASSTLSWS